MELKKYRWAKTYEAGESELIELLAHKKVVAERWTLDEFGTVESHLHPADTRFWCAEGSITFTVGTKEFPLQAGDALSVPAQMTFEATAGFAGCICYEAQL